MEVESDEGGFVLLEQGIDSCFEFTGVEGFRKIAFNMAFAVVGDIERIAKGNQHIFLALHEVGLEQVPCNHVAGLELEILMHPCKLFCDRFLLEEGQAKLTVGCETIEGGFVEIAIRFAHPHEYV